MNFKYYFILIILSSVNLIAKEGAGKKVIQNIKYKKYELLDFRGIDISGDNSLSSDIPVPYEMNLEISNDLPIRDNFNHEVIEAIGKSI